MLEITPPARKLFTNNAPHRTCSLDMEIKVYTERTSAFPLLRPHVAVAIVMAPWLNVIVRPQLGHLGLERLK